MRRSFDSSLSRTSYVPNRRRWEAWVVVSVSKISVQSVGGATRRGRFVRDFCPVRPAWARTAMSRQSANGGSARGFPGRGGGRPLLECCHFSVPVLAVSNFHRTVAAAGDMMVFERGSMILAAEHADGVIGTGSFGLVQLRLRDSDRRGPGSNHCCRSRSINRYNARYIGE